jgi:hypothetical protein
VTDCLGFSQVMNFMSGWNLQRQKRTELEKAERNEAREGRAEVMKKWHKVDED